MREGLLLGSATAAVPASHTNSTNDPYMQSRLLRRQQQQQQQQPNATTTYLPGAQPERPLASEVLGQNGKHALDRPQNGAVDDDRPLKLLVLRGVLQLEAQRQLEVQLDCGALKLAAQGIKDCDVDLGAVEGAVRFVHLHGSSAV